MTSKNLHIIFDANPLIGNRKSGVGYYTYGLIKALSETYPSSITLTGFYFGAGVKFDPSNVPVSSNISYKKVRAFHPKMLSIARRFGFQPPIELLVGTRRCDALLFTNFSALPSLSNIPTAVVVHDLAYLEKPEFVSTGNRAFLTRFVPQSVAQARIVFTISEIAKQAISSHYHIAQNKILVTPIPPLVPESTKTEQVVKGNYILFVGTIEPRKNIANLLKAYKALPSALRRKYSLVLAGGTGWNDAEIKEIISSLKQQGEQIITTGYISDETKASLYQHASLVVMPSHYEGFGMPILEAMSYGVPTAVSDIPVFHEVASNASVYFDQNDHLSIAGAMKKVITNSRLSQELSAKSLDHIKKFRWENVAHEVYKALCKISD